ncbi:hypothetical protein [Streptomyces sp. IB201691-2A2]|uniref:hypothetical protein n=1 Tax=Streptomyces sp. IB201691-2A2 TaxID=2561920 RepID=UPI00117D1895|nr:hypothetical protein [Streptomyces sp. IB201691-2A2]TRO58531.1 hypothetical protein E4K73_38380 [Streptomyces sp. IB201691-2A2]
MAGPAPATQEPVSAPTAAPAPAGPAPEAAPAAARPKLADELSRVLVPPDVPKEELALEGGAVLQPTPGVAAYLDGKGGEGGPVRVRIGSIAFGTLPLLRTGKGLVTPGKGYQPIPLLHPLLLPLRTVGIEPVVALRVKDGVVEGHASALVGGELLGDEKALLQRMTDCTQALGWPGIGNLRLPGIENQLRGPTLVVNVTGMTFKLGGFLDAAGSFGFANDTVTFDAVARGTVAGLGSVKVPVKRGPDGVLSGKVALDVGLRGFQGQVTAAFGSGVVDVQGTVRYANDKFDGSVTLVATDKESAEELTKSQLPEQVKSAGAAAAGTSAGPPPQAAEPAAAAPAPAAGPRPGPRVLAGWGTVNVRLAEWLRGEALVVVDHLGDVTVVGKIVPKMDKPLFEQKDYIKQLGKFEIRAAYGVPLVGNIFLFASIGLEALAKIGPATLTNMELTGTWSTKPEVLKNFGLTATLNISAFAGLRLKAEGGVGLELLGHDIKTGIALSALAGVRGYVEATPSIGFREVADPVAGKRGEFFFAGHMELAAQPFLLLAGELFVELDSPWWSPAPDKRWDWPLGRLEYPLPGEFGIGANVEHVLGSGKIPEVTFTEANFSADKFLTDLVNDHVPPKKSQEQEKKGTWAEPGAAAAGGAPAGAPPAKGPPPPAAEVATPGKGKPGKDGAPPLSPEKQKRWDAGFQALAGLAQRSHKDPYDEDELRDALAGIKKTHGFSALEPEPAGDEWQITAAMSPPTKKTPSVARDVKGDVGVDRARKGFEYHGGLYKDLKDPKTGKNFPGTEINHIPPHSVTNKLAHTERSKDEGPAIQMDKQDHSGLRDSDGELLTKLTASWGSYAKAKEHRADQLRLMAAGEIQKAAEKDTKDIKRKWPGKYNAAINELNVLLRSMNW